MRIVKWKKKGETLKGRQKKTEQRIEAMEQIREIKKAYMSAGTKQVTMTSVEPARAWRAHALAPTPGERYKFRAQSQAQQDKNPPS